MLGCRPSGQARGLSPPRGEVSDGVRLQVQYVVGAIHANTIEGFWSIFKRGIVGSFHEVSRKYMAQYVVEFQFRL